MNISKQSSDKTIVLLANGHPCRDTWIVSGNKWNK